MLYAAFCCQSIVTTCCGWLPNVLAVKLPLPSVCILIDPADLMLAVSSSFHCMYSVMLASVEPPLSPGADACLHTKE